MQVIQEGECANLDPFFPSRSMISSFVSEIYAVTASASGIWVICNEYKLTNFIVHFQPSQNTQI